MAKQKRNPRILVPFKPHTYELIRRLADLQDTSMAKVILQFFSEIEPMLVDIVVALEAAREAKGRPAAQLITAMAKLQSSIQGMTNKAVDQADMFAGSLSRTTEKLKKSAAKRPVKPVGARKRAAG